MQPDKIIRSNRKTIALQINEEAELIVRAPYLVPHHSINKFIEEKSEWIEKTRSKMLEKREALEQTRRFEDGKKIFFLGEEYEIQINSRVKKIVLHGDHIEFPFSRIKSAEEYLAKWYIKKAKEIIVPRVKQYAQALGFSYDSIGITSAKKRWGSCSSEGSLNFAYRLIMTPPPVIDYVIVHELMHLRELNHSERFWQHVEEVVPDYKAKRKWLKENQQRLQI